MGSCFSPGASLIRAAGGNRADFVDHGFGLRGETFADRFDVVDDVQKAVGLCEEGVLLRVGRFVGRGRGVEVVRDVVERRIFRVVRRIQKIFENSGLWEGVASDPADEFHLRRDFEDRRGGGVVNLGVVLGVDGVFVLPARSNFPVGNFVRSSRSDARRSARPRIRRGCTS